LLSDIDKHPRESPKIPKCDYIVVTGDLVAGARTDDENATEALKKQYSQAKDFLVRLSKELLNGDLRRLFIVPGNHDVSWSASRKSMERVEDLGSLDVSKALARVNSPYRWSWKELALYRIRSTDDYAKRLASFKEFFDEFYKSLGLTFSLQDQKQTLNFVTPDRRVLFTGFCSLYENDCFNQRGKISVDDVAASNLTIRESIMNRLPLKVAFWHHSVVGPEYHDDHLNSYEVLPQLIDHGFALGLHGHQHRSAVITYSYSLSPRLVMPIIASGSLCAGPYDIPPGHRRQYNMIEIDDASARVRVHVREWFEDTIWAPARLQEFGGKSFADVEIPILQEALQKSERKMESFQAVQLAEAFVRAKDYSSALIALANAPRGIPLVRKLLIESLHMKGKWRELIDLIEKPTNAEELTLMVDALLKVKEFLRAETIIAACTNEPDKYDRGLTNELMKRLDAERRSASA
jgi:hypothetical protein